MGQPMVPLWLFEQYKTTTVQIIEKMLKLEEAVKTYRIALDNVSEAETLQAAKEQADHALEQVKLMNVREAD